MSELTVLLRLRKEVLRKKQLLADRWQESPESLFPYNTKKIFIKGLTDINNVVLDSIVDDIDKEISRLEIEEYE